MHVVGEEGRWRLSGAGCLSNRPDSWAGPDGPSTAPLGEESFGFELKHEQF